MTCLNIETAQSDHFHTHRKKHLPNQKIYLRKDVSPFCSTFLYFVVAAAAGWCKTRNINTKI